MGLSAVCFGVYVYGMIDVSVKLCSKVKPKGSVCFQTCLYERDALKVPLVPRQRHILLHPGTK